ncbi:MAG TPA: DUF3048 domain-containing protein [Verrucomicrobiae bacterium]|jgi:hypothetical protein|nr:DUF3048 domain-containing protein [Verrucomicrobiae bacterium]
MDSDFKPDERLGGPLQGEHDDAQLETPKPHSETFQTPEEVAASDDITEPADQIASEELPDDSSAKQQSSKPATGWRAKLALHWPPGKKEWIVLAVVIMLAGIGTFLFISLSKPTPKPVATVQTIKAKPLPTTVPSTLSGLPVDPRINKLPVTGVMIENSDQARPQSGLGQASVVFEAVAEGGITRFLALYQDTAPANVGPIRSARPYYIQWALGFDAGYAHVGGSPDGLADIKTWNVRDLDEFYNGSFYHRISSRAAPHNVYTAIATLNQLEASKGYTSSTFSGFLRKKEAPVKVPTAKSINLVMSGPDYNVHYDYVAATNSYNRSEGGAAQIDANTNQQISPKVVVAMVIPETQGALDASGAYYSDYAVIGSGPVDVFQDGTVTTGTWTKSSNTSQITFATASGQPLKLNPGQTWLTAVSSSSDISYTP